MIFLLAPALMLAMQGDASTVELPIVVPSEPDYQCVLYSDKADRSVMRVSCKLPGWQGQSGCDLTNGWTVRCGLE